MDANLFVCILTYIKDGEASPRCKDLTGYKCIKSLKGLNPNNIFIHVNNDISDYQLIDIQREIKEITDVDIKINNFSKGKYSIGGAKNIMLDKVSKSLNINKWVLFLDDDDWLMTKEDRCDLTEGLEVINKVINSVKPYPVIFPKYKNDRVVPDLSNKDSLYSIFQGEFICRGYASTVFPVIWLNNCNLRFPEEVRKWDDVVFNVNCYLKCHSSYYLCWNPVYYQNDHSDLRNSKDTQDDYSQINEFIRYLMRYDDSNPDLISLIHFDGVKLNQVNRKFLNSLDYRLNNDEYIENNYIKIVRGQADLARCDTRKVIRSFNGVRKFTDINNEIIEQIVYRSTTLRDYMRFHDAWNMYNNSVGELKSIFRSIYYDKKYPENWEELLNTKLIMLTYE